MSLRFVLCVSVHLCTIFWGHISEAVDLKDVNPASHESAESTSGKSIRFALLIGANRGFPDEERLRFAERDAVRVGQVLTKFANVSASRSILTLDPTPEDLRRNLAHIQHRIKVAKEQLRVRALAEGRR